MNIIKPGYRFTGLTPVAKADKKYIVTHHPAARVYSPEQIHAQHTNQGWGGAGYHFYIRKDGSVYELRPTLTWGAHCNTHNKNKDGIGVSWEGNWDVETVMSKEQFQEGVDLYRYLMTEYSIPLANISRHLDWKPTSCPGRNFPWKSLLRELSNPMAPMTLIMGKSALTQEQAFSYIHRVNGNCLLTVRLSEWLSFYSEACGKYNIRAEVAIAQALHETNYLRYGGIVQSTQNNFAGLGAIDGNGKGQAATFMNARDGVFAQVQHLLAYASVENIRGIVDPRFHLVKRGSAPYVEYLSIASNPSGSGWATDPQYGDKIKRIMEAMLSERIEKQHWGVPLLEKMGKLGLVSGFHNPTDQVTWGELAAVVLNQYHLVERELVEIREEMKMLKGGKS